MHRIKTKNIILVSTILFFAIILFFYSCANVASLSGGPKDTIAPKLDSLKSTANFKTNFIPDKIVLNFNEWIELRNQNQILVSPPTGKKLEIKLKGKSIIIQFDKSDTLRENTTYNINFGKSIVDYTESNPYTNFSYIFSTGDHIDSLELKGKIINSFDKKAEKDYYVMLYESDQDSIVAKSKPYYFAISDDKGDFRISNLKEGKYKIFALKDANANFLYDNTSEMIGFHDTLVQVANDSLKKPIELSVFLPDLPLIIKESSITDFGKIKLVYSRHPDSLKILYSSLPIHSTEIFNDSTLIWFEQKNQKDSINLIIESENKLDTLNLKSRKNFSNSPLIYRSSKSGLSLHPDKAIVLEFNQPVNILNRDLIEITDTMGVKYEFSIWNDSLSKRKLFLKSLLKENSKYNLKILPGAFQSNFDQKNDTIISIIKTLKRENFGTLICKFDSLDINNQYIFRLMQKESKLDEMIIKGKNQIEFKYIGLEPGIYNMEVIIDENKNNRWNSGNYYLKQQSEKVFKFQLNELKRNWEQVEKLKIKSQ